MLSRVLRRWGLSTLFAMLMGAAPTVGILGWNAVPVEKDVLFHLAIARDYVSSFPGYDTKIQEGLLAEYDADRELLFHVVLAALLSVGFAPLFAAMLVSAAGSGAVAAVVYWHSRSYLAVVCATFGSSTVLYRALMGRPQALGVWLALLGIILLLKGRSRAAAFVNLIYTLSYSVPVVIVFAAFVIAVARRSRAPLLVILTSAIGFLVHPGFPDNVHVFWYQGIMVMMNVALGNPAQIALPQELESGLSHGLLWECWLPVVIFLVGVFRRTTEKPLAFMQGFFLVLSIFAVRFTEYFVPLVALSAAPTLGYFLPRKASARYPLLLLFLLYTAGMNTHYASIGARKTANFTYRDAALWLDRNGVRGHVFNAQWPAYSEIRYFAPQVTLAQGQDPLFVAAFSPERFKKMVRAERGAMSLCEFLTSFPARHIVSLNGTPILAYATETGVRPVYNDGKVVILKLPEKCAEEQ